MNSYLSKLKEYFEYMYERIGYNYWFSTWGTSLEYYLNKFNENKEKLLKRKVINLINDDDSKFMKQLWLPKEIDSDAPFRQFFSFLVSLNICRRINTNIWEFNYGDYEIDTKFIIEQWSKYNLTYEKSMLNAAALRVIYGFLTYSTFKVIGMDEFNNLYSLLDENIKDQIYSAYYKEYPKRRTPSYQETYLDFFDKYFGEYNVDNLLNLFGIIKNGLSDYELTEFDLELDKKFANTFNEKDYIKKKVDSINQIFEEDNFEYRKKTLREKISKVIRYKFKDFLKNEKNNFYIEGKDFGDKNLLEAAHIVSVEDIVDKIIDKKKKSENIEELIRKYTFSNNGMIIPFNYHKLYDKGYIEFSNDFKSFVLTKDGCKIKDYITMCGFNSNNNFSEEKSLQIKEVITKFENE